MQTGLAERRMYRGIVTSLGRSGQMEHLVEGYHNATPKMIGGTVPLKQSA